MKKQYIRHITGPDGENQEIVVDLAQDFVGKGGVRHPRNVLFLWSDEELWDELSIKVLEIDDTPVEVVDPITIPLPPLPPLPVPDQPLVPAPPAEPAAPPAAPVPMKLMTIQKLHDLGIEPTPEILEQFKKATRSDAKVSPLVAYGGIAFRTLTIEKKNWYHQGHRHNYDHMTNLIQGSVLCEVENATPKIFKAPAQITIAAEHWHKFTAMEDNVVYQCVYRQVERDDLYTNDNSPYNTAPFTKEELIHKLALLDNPCAHCDCDETKPTDEDIRD